MFVGVVEYIITNETLYLLPFASSGASWIIDNLNNLVQSTEIKIDKDLEL